MRAGRGLGSLRRADGALQATLAGPVRPGAAQFSLQVRAGRRAPGPGKHCPLRPPAARPPPPPHCHCGCPAWAFHRAAYLRKVPAPSSHLGTPFRHLNPAPTQSTPVLPLPQDRRLAAASPTGRQAARVPVLTAPKEAAQPTVRGTQGQDLCLAGVWLHWGCIWGPSPSFMAPLYLVLSLEPRAFALSYIPSIFFF